MAGDLSVLGQIAHRVLARLEEVEYLAAAAEARPLATSDAAQHDRLLWFPPRSLARVEPYPDLAGIDRVTRVDFDRDSEHRRDPERIDRAHRLHPVLLLDQDTVPARLRRERIGHDRAAVPVDVDEVLARENSKCFGGIDPESCRCGAGRFFARRSRGSELAQDPEVELALRS